MSCYLKEGSEKYCVDSITVSTPSMPVILVKFYFHLFLINLFLVPVSRSIGNPDPVGSGPFCRIWIRKFLPNPCPRSGSDPPKGAYCQSEKVIFSHQHFHYRYLYFSFSANSEKKFRTLGQNYLKQRHFALFF
jgi:hypothetical protein